jgi:hypothetical protein
MVFPRRMIKNGRAGGVVAFFGARGPREVGEIAFQEGIVGGNEY